MPDPYVPLDFCPQSWYNYTKIEGEESAMELKINEPWITSKVRCQNGYVYKEGMDIEPIFDKTLKARMKAYDEKISPLWEKVLNGEL